MFINKTLQLSKLKTRPDINAIIEVFVISVESIIFLLLHILPDCTFKLLREHISLRGLGV